MPDDGPSRERIAVFALAVAAWMKGLESQEAASSLKREAVILIDVVVAGFYALRQVDASHFGDGAEIIRR